MLSASENCARTPPAALLVEPAPSSSRSISTTSGTPASARWKAILVPITPPPTTTTLARLGRPLPGRVTTVDIWRGLPARPVIARCDTQGSGNLPRRTARCPTFTRRLVIDGGFRVGGGGTAISTGGPGEILIS